MNYGYEDTHDWPDDLVEGLAWQLTNLCGLAKFADSYGMHPYVELDMLYPGIRIRRITHLTQEQHDELVKEADKLYLEWKVKL